MVSGNTGFAGPHPQGWRDSWPCAAVLLSAECWCWDTADLISSLDILLAFASDICDRWHICDNPLLSQIVQGPGASPCYLALSIALAVTVDPQVSATSSIYSWLAWFPHAVICPCPNLGSIPWGDARWTQLCLTALLVTCLELALHSGLCPEFPEETRGRLCLPVVPPARGGGGITSPWNLPNSLSISLPSDPLCKATDVLNDPLLLVPSFQAHLRCKCLFWMSKAKE